MVSENSSSDNFSFDGSTWKQYNTSNSIYNIKGQKVRELPIVTPSPSHTLSVTWDGTDENNKPVSSGIYLYQPKGGNKFSQIRKMLLLR